MIAVNSHKQTAVLALGGGGARGIAHLGVIEVLQQTPIQVNHLVGVSIGSLAGALCAVDSDTRGVQKRVVDYLTSEEFQSNQAELFRAAPPADEPGASGLFAWYGQIRRFLGARQKLTALFSKSALLEASLLRNIIEALLPDIDIRDTRLPLSIVALDLLSGKEVVLTEGSLREAVVASASIPGVFPPVRWENRLLCDIGMMDSIPARVARSRHSDLTIAVDVSSKVEPVQDCRTAADIFMRLYNIGESLVRNYTVEIADLVIRPDVSETQWYDFSRPQDLIELGRAAARQYLVCDPSRLPAVIPASSSKSL
ncbi:MAG: patatin-like phospholipase family protein [Planctomycetaceae bacterium]